MQFKKLNQNQCILNLKQTVKIKFKKSKPRKSKTLKNKLNTKNETK